MKLAIDHAHLEASCSIIMLALKDSSLKLAGTATEVWLDLAHWYVA